MTVGAAATSNKEANTTGPNSDLKTNRNYAYDYAILGETIGNESPQVQSEYKDHEITMDMTVMLVPHIEDPDSLGGSTP